MRAQSSLHAVKSFAISAQIHHQMLCELEALESEQESNLPPI
jgi:hypothetical protein